MYSESPRARRAASRVLTVARLFAPRAKLCVRPRSIGNTTGRLVQFREGYTQARDDDDIVVVRDNNVPAANALPLLGCEKKRFQFLHLLLFRFGV